MKGSSGKKLNKEQLEAVKYKKGPLLIIAGAGTGKTTVITERIKWLIQQDLAKPSEILALTFTEKAAKEMEERVDVAMPYGYTQMWISTFHSFCDRVLRQDALHIGLDPRYKLLTQTQSIRFIRDNLFEFELDYFRPLGNPTKYVQGMLQHFSRLQDEDVSPSQYLDWVKGQRSKVKGQKLSVEDKEDGRKWDELAKAYKKYDELKVKEGIFDFGDLIVKTLEIFRRRPNVLKEYQKKFKYILVDEFQDTNIAQNELVKIMAGSASGPRGPQARGGNITVVLDDDQSIYRFRGAAVSNALQFRKSFPKTKTISLIKNYRSAQEILDKAYRLIQFNNPDRLEVIEKVDKRLISVKHLASFAGKKLVAQKKITGEVGFIHTDRVENEAEETAKTILNLVNEGEYNWKDIAILVRANNHADPFIRAFQRKGIPYQFLGPGRLFKQPEIVDLISYLKLLYNIDDSSSLYRVFSMDYFGIPAKDMVRIGNHARRINISLFDALENIEDIYVGAETKRKAKKFIKIVGKHLKLIRKETAGQLLYYFLQDTGLLQKLLNPDTPDAQKRAKNISKFFDKLKTYEVDNEDATVPSVVDWIELSSELGESPLAADIDWSDIDAVNILTVHSSKGLEFPVVFLINLVGQRFPTTQRSEQIPIPKELIKEVLPKGDYHIQEERRLFYVGMTRAKERLFFTAADYYGEGKREKKLSPFIFEALGDEAVSAEIQKEEGQQLSFLDYKPEKNSEEIKSQLPSTIYQPPNHIDYLSYSQIQTFLICPLHYKLRYIYKVPTPPTSSQSFGNSFHQTMKVFHEEVQKGKKGTEKLIHEILREKWINEGYMSKSHEQKSFDKAKLFLSYYLKKQFDSKILPIAMEQPFLVKITSSKGDDHLKIGGKIDRIDEHKNKIWIIDYKTGANPPTQKEVDSDLQLSIYALAATSIPESPFNRKAEEIDLSLMFFDTPQTITTRRTKGQLDQAVKQIFDYKKQIEQSDFKCSNHYLCQKGDCEYKLFCRTDE